MFTRTRPAGKCTIFISGVVGSPLVIRICINQSNISERNAHVRYISLVYSKSQGNLVYLGKDDNGTAGLAFDTLMHLSVNNLAMTKSIKAGSDEAGALSSLFSRPWFRRAWVVQEVVLGGVSRCHLRKHEIMLRLLINVALAVRRAAEWQSTSELSQKFGPEATIAVENLVNLNGLREQYKKGIPTHGDIAELIQRSRECSNPRDMVYSVIGLVDPAATGELPP